MGDNSDSEGKLRLSKYNSAGDQLERIDNLWSTMHTAVKARDFDLWNVILDRIWMELGGDLAPGCEEEKFLLELNKKIAGLYPLFSATKSTFNKREPISIIKVSQQYQVLSAKELFLRRVQNKLGKGTAWIDEYEDDF